jgi:hypothetical protein
MHDSPPSRLSGWRTLAPPVCDQSWNWFELEGANLTWLADLTKGGKQIFEFGKSDDFSKIIKHQKHVCQIHQITTYVVSIDPNRYWTKN